MPLKDLLNVTPVDTKVSLFEKGIPHLKATGKAGSHRFDTYQAREVISSKAMGNNNIWIYVK